MNKNIVSIICTPFFCMFLMQHALSQNIIQNGDFEDYFVLPTQNSQIQLANSWHDVISDCDYINGSYSGYAPQLGGAYSGTGYAGFATYGLANGSAEAIGQNISTSPITTSSAYHIEFYAKKSVSGAYSQTCGSIHLYGFITPPPIDWTNVHAQDIPGATLLWSSGIVDESQWAHYSGCFTSNTVINYVVITLTKTPNCSEYVYLDSLVIESVSFDSLIVADLGSDTTLCKGDSLVLNTTFPNANYAWNDNSTNPNFVVKHQGTYWVEVSNSCGAARDTIIVDFDSLATVSLGEDTVICAGMTFNLSATSPDASYLWDDGTTDSIVKIQREGTYWVSITNRCGTISDTITVSPAAISTVDIGNDTVLCNGETLPITIVPIPDVSYLWQDGASNLPYNIKKAGTYWLAAINVCGIAVDTLNVAFDSLPNVNFGENLILCENEHALLNSICQKATYTWQDNSATPSYTVTQEGTYWVEVINHCGTSSDTVIADYVNCFHTLFIPNSFSPNNDGLNDHFGPKCDCSFSEYHFLIFNRWGERLFETRDPLEAWSGCSERGRDLQTGVYIYQLKYKIDGENATRSETGDVTLLK